MVGDFLKRFIFLRAQCEEKRRGYNSKSKSSVRLDCYDVGAFIARLMYMVSKLSTTCNLLFTLVFYPFLVYNGTAVILIRKNCPEHTLQYYTSTSAANLTTPSMKRNYLFWPCVKVYGLKVRLAQTISGCSGAGGPSDCEGTL